MLKRVEKGLRQASIAGAVGLLVIASAAQSARSEGVVANTSNPDLNEQAQELLAQRKWTEAAVILRAELRRDPKSPAIAADIAKALLYLHRREEAAEILGRAIELNRGSKKDWLIGQLRLISKIFVTNTSFQTYQDGVDLLTAQKARNAREKFEQALSAEPANVEVLTRLGQAYLLDKDYDSAAERLKRAQKIDPYEPEIHLWLGRTLEFQGDRDGGLSELREAASQLKQSELAPTWLAEALAASGNVSEAIDVLEQDVKNNPIHVGALVELAQLKIRDVDASQDTLWSARKDFQNALSRLGDYEQPGRRRFEGELGVEIFRSSKDLRDQIQSELQKLESRLEAESER